MYFHDDIQAREEHDFDPKPEVINLYAQACAEQSVAEVFVPEGRFGVVQVGVAYCPWTDAVLPNPFRSLMVLYDTREEADFAAAMYDLQAEGDDTYHEVWPRAAAVASGSNAWEGEEDIPF